MKLSNKSNELITFFSKNRHFSRNTFTGRSSHILMQLYEDILNGHTYVNTHIPQLIPTCKTIHTSAQIPKPRQFNALSFPSKIIRHIDAHIMHEMVFTFSLYHRNIKVYFMNERVISQRKWREYVTYAKAVAVWIYISHKYSKSTCSNTLNIYIYLTSYKKELPSTHTTVLNEFNMNTAFTQSCPRDAEIVIYRKEEWFKVFIHETFHSFGLDFSTINDKYVTRYVLNIFKVNSKVNAYEAYTEFWAEIINASFTSFYTLPHHPNEDEFIYRAEVYINWEATYSFFQMVKVLKYMGLTYTDLYSTYTAHQIRYKENTNILSYYILKAVLFNNCQGFLHWCDVHNSNLLNFKKTSANLRLFCEFIERNYKTPTMLDNVAYAEEFYSNLYTQYGKKKDPLVYFILTNLRMTMCELE